MVEASTLAEEDYEEEIDTLKKETDLSSTLAFALYFLSFSLYVVRIWRRSKRRRSGRLIVKD